MVKFSKRVGQFVVPPTTNPLSVNGKHPTSHQPTGSFCSLARRSLVRRRRTTYNNRISCSFFKCTHTHIHTRGSCRSNALSHSLPYLYLPTYHLQRSRKRVHVRVFCFFLLQARTLKLTPLSAADTGPKFTNFPANKRRGKGLSTTNGEIQ